MNDNYATDNSIMQIFEEWFDPCPLNPEYKINALDIEW